MIYTDNSYSIGEAAELLRVSRDTLRIYEEEGLIKPARDTNGYRIYSDEDLLRFISIRFLRMNSVPMSSIKDITRPGGEGEAIEAREAERGRPEKVRERASVEAIIRERIEAEKREALRHRRNMERLKLALKYYEPEGIGDPCLRDMCLYRVSEERGDFTDTLKDWFQMSSSDEDLAMCYLCTHRAGSGECSAFLVIKDYELKAVGRRDLMREDMKLPLGKCLVRRVFSPEPVPSEEEIGITLGLAKEFSFVPRGDVYSYFTCRHDGDFGEGKYLLELCMPVK